MERERSVGYPGEVALPGVRCRSVDDKTIKAAESILSRGERVELIPVKDGVKVVRVRREEVKK